jgi:P27 family predicted phage terminase small subunit
MPKMSNQMGTPSNKLFSSALSEEVDERLLPPEAASAEFKDLWNRITGDKKPNFFMDSDAEILQEYVTISLQMKGVSMDLEAEGYVVDTPQGEKQHPLVQVMSALRRQQLSYARILGIGPGMRNAETTALRRAKVGATVKKAGGVLIPLAGGRKG